MSSTLASGDIGKASKYGDVFTEVTSNSLEADCQDFTCYVACSCNNSEGWYDSEDGALGTDTRAEVFEITSEKHYGLTGSGTSSLGDLLITPMSTLNNQTPLTVSTNSTQSLVAPRVKTASVSSSMATCYKKKTCEDMGYYDSASDIDSNYFTSDDATNECYKVTGCNTDNGAFTENPNADFFVVTPKTSDRSNETTCYRATGCASDKLNVPANIISSVLGGISSYFVPTVSVASGTICVGEDGCASGAYSSKPNVNTAYFDFTSQTFSGTGNTCYKISCSDDAYTSSPNTNFFYTSKSEALGKTCYKGSCKYSPNTTYFYTISSTAVGETCYRASSCNSSNGYSTTAPNSTYFNIDGSSSNGLTCSKATSCRCGYIEGNYNNHSGFWPNYNYFTTQTSGDVTCTMPKETIETYSSCQSLYYVSCMNSNSTQSTASTPSGVRAGFRASRVPRRVLTMPL